jgi:protein-tyrosine phosphatase
VKAHHKAGVGFKFIGTLLTLEIELVAMKKVLMVCMGNICRSPIALAVARKLAADAGHENHFEFDSAGTHTHRAGERPDPRVMLTLSRHGYALERFRSRKISPSDFSKFDLILAADARVLADLQQLCPPAHKDKLRLLLDCAQDLGETDIPDPYFGNTEGFERVLHLCEAGARGVLKQLA